MKCRFCCRVQAPTRNFHFVLILAAPVDKSISAFLMSTTASCRKDNVQYSWWNFFLSFLVFPLHYVTKKKKKLLQDLQLVACICNIIQGNPEWRTIKWVGRVESLARGHFKFMDTCTVSVWTCNFSVTQQSVCPLQHPSCFHWARKNKKCHLFAKKGMRTCCGAVWWTEGESLFDQIKFSAEFDFSQ